MARVACAEELGTVFKNNLREIPFEIRPIWVYMGDFPSSSLEKLIEVAT